MILIKKIKELWSGHPLFSKVLKDASIAGGALDVNRRGSVHKEPHDIRMKLSQ